MNKSSQNNGKCLRWTAEEHALLLKNLETFPKRIDAVAKTAEQTGRTYAAIFWRADNLGPDGSVMPRHRSTVASPNAFPLKKEVTNPKTPVITYYNGTTRKAQVIVNTKNLIVAKFHDVVITIEL
jgi:hypothetical protein